MNKLDDLSIIQKLDPSHTLDSICQLWKQCAAAWQEAKQIKIPDSYRKISSVVFCGMGGSAYGARIIKSLYGLKIKIPIDIVSDYHIADYVSESTLVITASYSGTTEETIQCAQEAIEKKAKIIGITLGGPLFDLLNPKGYPCYRFDPKYNPSGQPRIGQGYMQIGQISLLQSLGLLQVTEDEVTTMVSGLENAVKNLNRDIKTDANPAKKLALKFENKVVNIIAAEFLEGAVHSIRNPFHETGKHFANYFIVPELNHHLLEGLSFPASLKKDFLFVIIGSDLYSPRIQKRMIITKEVLKKQGIETLDIKLTADTGLKQVFELIQLGSFVTFYLAILHAIDPAKIPWVDYFKQKLKQSV